jgi:hypothetical protein
MKIDCTQLDDLLLDGSPAAMETAARHAQECEACAETLAAWNELTDTARTMRGAWENDLLWPRIERALRAEKTAASEHRAGRRDWGRSFRRTAAAFLLTAGLGGTVFYAVRVRSHEAAFDRDILRLSAMDEVERAEQAHVQAIRKLESLAEPKLEEAESPLLVSYKEKLMLLDDAIAECQANIDHNRQNAHLREQLLSMYSEKQQTLRDVLVEESHVATP